MKRLHIGSGAVYLRDWLNIDLKGPRTFLAADRPDLVKKWGTDDAHYYAKHQDKTIDTTRQGPLDQEYVCDAYGHFGDLPLPYWDADEVLARHSFEHLSFNEARAALDILDSVMKVGAILRLDVPDHEATLREYHSTGDEFYIRHLLGPRRNEYGFHMMSYTRETLRNLVEDHGFVFVSEEPNIHFYPAFCLRFEKRDLLAPRDYVKPPYAIPDDWNVLEIGPGGYPYGRADCVVDWNAENLKPLQSKRTVVADLMHGLPMFKDKEFDYVWASHIFEHIEDPIAGAKTLSRVARCGTIIMPSAWKEALTNFEQPQHKWMVLPNPKTDGPPVFVRGNLDQMEKIKDQEVMKAFCRLFRTGPNRMAEEHRLLRSWWRKTEPVLDVVCHWEDNLEVVVIN